MHTTMAHCGADAPAAGDKGRPPPVGCATWTHQAGRPYGSGAAGQLAGVLAARGAALSAANRYGRRERAAATLPPPLRIGAASAHKHQLQIGGSQLHWVAGSSSLHMHTRIRLLVTLVRSRRARFLCPENFSHLILIRPGWHPMYLCAAKEELI